MRLGKVFAAGAGGVEGALFVALAVVAHRLDAFVELQVFVAPIAVVAGIVATGIVLVRGRRSARAAQLSEDVPQVDARALLERIGGAAPVALPPQRRDARVGRTHRP